MHKIPYASAIFSAALLSAATCAVSAEYSAVTVEIRPGQDMQTGSLYVSKTASRYEFRSRGLPVVRILIPGKGIMRLLFPIDKSYIEYRIQPDTKLPGQKPDNPCQPSAALDCVLIAQDRINGMNAERWSIKPKGRPGEVRMWWDKARKMALRQEFFDGRVMQATLRGVIKFEQQQVEDWEFTYMSPDGRYQRSVALISPELGVAVVEKLPGGAVRRMHSVTIGPPEPSLFEVPADYKLIEPQRPALEQQPTASAARGPTANSKAGAQAK